MLTHHQVIEIVTDLISKCHASERHNLGELIWESLTDKDTQARDLTFITVTAIALASVAMDYTGLGVEPVLDNLRFENTWQALTAQLQTQEGDGGVA